MHKEVVEIRIGKTGDFTFKPREGFTGASCIKRTKDLELALGGVSISQEKTDDYFKPEKSSPLTIKLK